MIASLKDISSYLLREFNYAQFNDASVNGLQVESCDEIRKIVASVDFGLSIANKAKNLNAELILCHHGILWSGSSGKSERIVSSHRDKIKFLLDNGISLIGIHLPLDAHYEFGNNIIIARDLLKLEQIESAVPYQGVNIGFKGVNNSSLSLKDFSEIFENVPGALPKPLVLPFGPEIPKKVCVVSGSSADTLYLFENEDFDTLISGEPKQFAYQYCKDNNINAIFAGHYATETFGVRAITEHLAKRFSLDWVFIDEPSNI